LIENMNWILAGAAPALVAVVYGLSGCIHPAILAYHVLCAVAVYRRRSRVRALLSGGRAVLGWTLATTGLVVAALLLAPWLEDLTSYRALFRKTLLPWERPGLTFALFAVYSMIVHAPLEEALWRGVVLDLERGPWGAAVAGNAVFFGLLHAAPLSMILGARGALLALPALAAGAVWAFVTIRSRSLWPGLVSHWGADGVILGLMWFYFIR
jgi:membrane protease YdiL (CAAX protease family)